MTDFTHKDKFKSVVKNASQLGMLNGSRLVLSVDIHDEDQVHMYEPLSNGESVMHVGTIIIDSLSSQLVTMLGENTAVVVEINLIGIPSTDEGVNYRGG